MCRQFSCSILFLLKLCIHKHAAYALRHSRAACIWHAFNKFSVNLRRAKNTRCMERTPGASNSLCVCTKNRQISVRCEWHVNHSRMVHRFAVWSTHLHVWFMNRSLAVCEPFDTLVYTRLKADTKCVRGCFTSQMCSALGC